MDKKPLSESDICDKFIRPAMEAAGWNGMEQIYREFPLRAGRVVVRGQKSYRDKTTVVRAYRLKTREPDGRLQIPGQFLRQTQTVRQSHAGCTMCYARKDFGYGRLAALRTSQASDKRAKTQSWLKS